MKVTLERNHLLKSLSHVHRVVERRNTYPILANVLFKASDDKVELRATDLDIEVTESVPAMVSTPGTTTVPAHTLYEIVRKLADGAEVRLETDGGENMVLTSGRSRFNLACLSPDSFPDLKSGAFGHEFSMPVTALRELIERTQFAISNEETRYYLNGIYFHTIDISGTGTVLRAVATDGHRMARAEIEAPAGANGMPGIIVPKKTVGEVQKLLDGAEGDVAVEVSDTKIRFTTAVDRVSTIASERGGKAVKLQARDGLLELSVTNPDHGTASEELAVEFETDGFEIGFNARYLLDIIGQIRSDSAIFMFNDAGSPTLVKDEGETRALYVLIPMRV